MPSLHQLECFVIYGRVKNFSQVAKEANITQSAFSAQMKKLEEILGIALIHRSNRGSCLTEAGENFLGKAQAYVDGLHEIVYEIQAQAGKAPIELNVAVLRSLGDVHMNRHVSYFQQQNKKICFNVFDMEEDEIRKGLFEGHIDVASVYRFESDAYADFVCTHFSDDEIIFFAPHVSAPLEGVGQEWMENQPLVYYPPNSSMNKVYQEYFARKLPLAAAHLSTPYAMMHFCQENPVGALLPRCFIEALGITRGFYTLRPMIKLEAVLVYKKDNPRSRYIRMYVDYILKIFRGK